LFYVLDNSSGRYNIHLATSADGVHFSPHSASLVLSTSEGRWDSQTVTTPRIFFDRGLYYMIYAGDDRSKDDPSRFGLATSIDLIEWTKYQSNPILRFQNRKKHGITQVYGTEL
jgi:predicted GH43/DUF377 family glycosyl hydrolase